MTTQMYNHVAKCVTYKLVHDSVIKFRNNMYKCKLSILLKEN